MSNIYHITELDTKEALYAETGYFFAPFTFLPGPTLDHFSRCPMHNPANFGLIGLKLAMCGLKTDEKPPDAEF